MCKLDEIVRRLGNIENNQGDFFKRIRTMEIEIAKAQGAKAGVIFAFSLMWAVALTGVAAAWKWLHT